MAHRTSSWPVAITVESHPLLDLRAFLTEFPRQLGELPVWSDLAAMFASNVAAPLASSDAVREPVRALLRHGGFRPAGRSKPASEYLLRAATEGTLGSINQAVDACNVVSLHSGLPISVIDLDRAQPPLRVGLAPTGASYVFNSSGQSIDVSGLICLEDASGPCANAVKDAQRTKTDATTRRTLTIIWGTKALPTRSDSTLDWYRQLLQEHGATTEIVTLHHAAQSG